MLGILGSPPERAQESKQLTPVEEIIAIGKERHGDNWKTGLSVDTGWSWWTFNRIERGKIVTPKVYKAVTGRRLKVKELRAKGRNIASHRRTLPAWEHHAASQDSVQSSKRVRHRSASIPHTTTAKKPVAASLTFILISLSSYFIPKVKRNRLGTSDQPTLQKTYVWFTDTG
jgi:hypothetical protein